MEATWQEYGAFVDSLPLLGSIQLLSPTGLVKTWDCIITQYRDDEDEDEFIEVVKVEGSGSTALAAFSYAEELWQVHKRREKIAV
jgi:hypothetical protein